jgi:hypothetical protein
MPLARLENLLKNLNGNILYVDPAQLDATDSIENKGNSALRPFKTIQRALLEAVRFSYVQGSNNDLFDQTTILISPGTHYIDNRPGFYVDGDIIKSYSGSTAALPELTLESNFDIDDPLNDLFKFNSADGGVIIPRGVSIVASDLRKTKVRPKYVPNPSDDSIPRTSIFRLTGACYIYGFSIFDGDPNGNVYSNPTSTNELPPSYSHHKLTAFEYADGKNKYVKNQITLDKTDLEMYYYKVAKSFGQNSGVPNILDWGVSSSPDLYPNIEENRIVGDLGRGTIPITSLFAGNGVDIPSNVVTVETDSEHGLTPLSSILISNIGSNTQERAEYNGSFTVAQVISSTRFTYRISDIPESTLTPAINTNSAVSTASDTVSSSSPYVFNCSLKSVYGMNGLHADGSKATGFKSMVTAQFTGISLQKDDRAFVLYNETSGTYNDQSSYPNEYLHQNSRSLYKPSWESFHIKASNDAFIQCVSIFAIGYAKQFIADNGGDQSITNSNSNFGAIALTSRGFKDFQLAKDDHGYITHIIPPKELTSEESDIRCLKIDSSLTTTVNNSTRVYLQGYDNILDPPVDNFRGYKIGARSGEKIYISDSEFAVVSPNYKLEFNISSINDVTDEIIVTSPVTVNSSTSGLSTSQTVRIFSENGILPDGIENGRLYYINQDTLLGVSTTSEFKLSETLFNSTDSSLIVDIKNSTGVTTSNLKIVTKVSDRSPGEVASPFQFDSTRGNWYISIESKQSFIDALDSVNDPVFYIKRIIDTRKSDDKLYRARIVIPKESLRASEPSTGFIIQRSSSELTQEYSSALSNPLTTFSDSRNRGKIIDAWTVSGTPNTCHIVTKYPHKLKPGNKININNLKSSAEPAPIGLGTGTGYNGSYIVDTVVNDLTFTFKKSTNPGTISTVDSTAQTWLNVRNCSSSTYRVAPYTIENDEFDLPYFTCEELNNDYQIYKVSTIQRYSQGVSDGIYYAILNVFKNTPETSPFNTSDIKLSQNIENLYPDTDLDNPVSDPLPTKSIASRQTIGKVEVNDPERSVTKETTSNLFEDFGIGLEVTSISKSGNNCTITTATNHGLRGIKQLTVPGNSVGSGFVPGNWYDIPLCGGSGSGATAQILVSSGGAVTGARIINTGSGYAVNDTLTVRGIPHTTTNGSSVNITVSSVQNSSFGLIQVLNSKNPSNDGIFPVSSINDNTITYVNSNGVSETSSSATVIFSGDLFTASTVTGTTNTTITTTTRHSISVGNKVYFSSIPSQLFNVISVPSATTFQVSGNASSVGSASDKSLYVVELSPSLRESNSSTENLSSRQYVLRSSISVRSSNTINGDLDITDTSLSLTDTYGFDKGDFIQVDDEIMLVASISITGSSLIGQSLTIKRGCLGTKPSAHVRNSLVKKLNIPAIELRRPSILRASGHTFEYLGFGPGNYSTGMPTNQSRVLTSDEVLISQSLPTRGGSVLYTGMNSDGDYFIGRKKFNTLTGEEELLGVSEVESGPLTAFDDLTITSLTVTNKFDASTVGISEFKNITAEDITANSFNGNLTGEVNATSFDTNASGVVVTGIATATSFVGRGTIPIGGIIMWSGTEEDLDSTPEWKLCDGTNGTPDLRNKFIVAANNISKTGITTQTGSSPYDPGDVGGNADSIVPYHNHTITEPNGGQGHRHGVSEINGQTGLNGSSGNDFTNDGGTLSNPVETDYAATGITINYAGTSGNATNANLPPYYALAFIMRVS